MTTPVLPDPSTPFIDLKTGMVKPEWFLFLNSLIGSSVTSVGVSGANGIGVSGSPITSSGTIALSLGALTPTSVAATGAMSGSNLSGTNTGDQTITLTGDVTGSGSGSFAASIGTNKVTNALLAQMAANTFKMNNTAGTANAVDATATQAAAVLGVVGGCLKSFVKLFTRDLTAATASVGYTGVGFKPSALIAFTANGTTNVGLAGYCDSALNQACTWSSSYTYDGTALIRPGTAGNDQQGIVTSLDSDGFTISWTKTGAPGGTVNCAVLCLR